MNSLNPITKFTKENKQRINLPLNTSKKLTLPTYTNILNKMVINISLKASTGHWSVTCSKKFYASLAWNLNFKQYEIGNHYEIVKTK